MKGFRSIKGYATILLAIPMLALWSCSGNSATNDAAPVTLVITNIVGITEQNGSPGTPSSVLLSNVSDNGSIFNDNAQLTFLALPKNPNVSLTTSTYDAVFLDQYSVVYTRTDGQNQQGVDVPYAISGAMAIEVPAGSGSTTNDQIIVVRHQAKSEPPLSLLEGGGQQNLLTVEATITVYGHTLNGQTVSASGTLEIVFAQFASTTG